MAGTRLISFDPRNLLHLLIHYTQDHENQIPLDGEVIGCGVSPVLSHWLCLTVRSSKWNDPGVDAAGQPLPLHIRYEGKKTMAWGSKGETKGEWKDGIEGPNGS
jgi:hypothetical protein